MKIRPRSNACAGLLAASIAGLVACSQPAVPDIADSVSQWGMLELLESDSPPILLDVRTAREFETGHIPGAINIPYDELDSRVDEVGDEREREVVVYCERGGRAAKALSTLRDAGFTSASHLEGDMSAWRSQDLPCVGC